MRGGGLYTGGHIVNRFTWLRRLSIVTALVGVVVFFPSWSFITLAVVSLAIGAARLANAAIKRFLVPKASLWVDGFDLATLTALMVVTVVVWPIHGVHAGGLVMAVLAAYRLAEWLEKTPQQRAIEKAGGGCTTESGEVVSLNLRSEGVSNTTLATLGVMALPHLRELFIEETQVTDAGLEHLNVLGELRGLSLQDSKVTDAVLEHVKELTSLEFLVLSGTQVTGAGLEHVKELTSLEFLELSGTQVTDAGLEHLKGLSDLQILGLGDTKISDVGLEHLEGLRSLKDLRLDNTQVTDAGVNELRKALPNCRILH
jgi:Leucine-rich repeat (LRR) protein